MSVVASHVHVVCPLEIQSAFARGVGQRLDAAVIEVAAAVEDHVLDALFLRALGDQLADRFRGGDTGAGLEPSGSRAVFSSEDAETSVAP